MIWGDGTLFLLFSSAWDVVKSRDVVLVKVMLRSCRCRYGRGLAVAAAGEPQVGVGAPEGEAASALVVDKARRIARRLPEDIRLSSPKEPPQSLPHTRQSDRSKIRRAEFRPRRWRAKRKGRCAAPASDEEFRNSCQ